MGWLGRDRRSRDELERAFLGEILVHWDGLYRFAYRLAGDATAAEDLVQETLTKAYKAFGRLREDTNLRGWVYTILRNTFLSRARRAGRERSLEVPEQVEDRRPLPQTAALVRREDGFRHGFEDEVLAALDALPEAQRSAVLLCDVEGFTYDEIAGVLDCPVGTVRSRIHHARRRLREALGGYASAKGYDDVESGR